MVELMEGTIECESEVGKGTTFTITLDIPVAERQLEEMRFENVDALIADDDPVLLDTAADALESLGICTERARSGPEALEMIRRRHAERKDYGVVILDWRMPGMNGLDATRNIRKLENKWAASIPIIAMTADAFSENVAECLETGMNGHIAKPVDMKLVIKEIRRIKEEKKFEI